LIPLPREISITEKVEVEAADVQIRVREEASELEKNAAAILSSLFKEKRRAVGGSRPAGFEILLGVCSDQGMLQNHKITGARNLWRVPNWEQAYVICPLGHNRVALTAPDPRGVYYAARTFAQLIQSRFSGDRVSIPLARVRDWPDLSERGEWGGSAESDIAWFGEHKLNLVESGTVLRLDENGRGVAQVNEDLLGKETEVGLRLCSAQQCAIRLQCHGSCGMGLECAGTKPARIQCCMADAKRLGYLVRSRSREELLWLIS
jgi:hypothetical protein